MKAPRHATNPAYEVRDMAPRHIGYSAAILFGGIAISVGLVAGLFAVLDRTMPKPPATAMETAPLAPPLPRLEIDGRADRAAVEADAQRKLDGYAWADPAANTARIPIDRAMQLLVVHGWPDPAKGSGAP
jgi:hypothetical protein